jgi:hypothetical protein
VRIYIDTYPPPGALRRRKGVLTHLICLCPPVVEAYSDSWGPCGSVGTLLKKFLTEASPPEGGLEVLVCKAEGNALLDKYTQQSTPHFLFYRNGALLQTIAGPNVPALEAALRAHCPKTGEVPPFGDDPALNKFTTAPAARPTTAGRPRTADLLRQSRSGSMAKSEAGPRLSGVAAGPRLSGAAPHRPSVVVPAMADVEEES